MLDKQSWAKTKGAVRSRRASGSTANGAGIAVCTHCRSAHRDRCHGLKPLIANMFARRWRVVPAWLENMPKFGPSDLRIGWTISFLDMVIEFIALLNQCNPCKYSVVGVCSAKSQSFPERLTGHGGHAEDFHIGMARIAANAVGLVPPFSL
jgi:hypothetical protein